MTYIGPGRRFFALLIDGLIIGLAWVPFAEVESGDGAYSIGWRGLDFVIPMLITARAMKTGLALIRPLLAAKAEKPVGTFVMGTVLGDMHDIGQSIVTIMLENAGFRVINLGTDVHPDRFIKAAVDQSRLV